MEIPAKGGIHDGRFDIREYYKFSPKKKKFHERLVSPVRTFRERDRYRGSANCVKKGSSVRVGVK